MRSRWKFASIGLVLTGAALSLAWNRGGWGPRATAQTTPELDAVAAADVAALMAHYATTPALTTPRAAVLPHHLTARSLITELVQSLRAADPGTIVVIGPDHDNAGTQFVTTSASDWQGGGAQYRVDRGVVQELIELDHVALNDDVLRREHSVFVPLPFLAARFPNARFVLLAVRGGFDRPAITAVAERLHAALGPNDLVIASVDFSHYQGFQKAEEEDGASQKLLEGDDPEKLSSIVADSPAALAITMKFARLRDATDFDIVRHANSAQLLGDLTLLSTTSYFTGVWR